MSSVGRSPSLQPQKASTMLAAKIRADILEHEMTVGSELPSEADLIEGEALSRSTVREALRILEYEGLIEVRRGKSGGVFVARPDVRHLGQSLAYLLSVKGARTRDLLEYRLLIEPMIARMVAERATPEGIERVRSLAEDDHSADSPAFHVELARLCGNAIVSASAESFFSMLQTFRLEFVVSDQDREEACAAHRKLARLIAERDGEGAARAMESHVRAYATRMEELGGMEGAAIPLSRWRVPSPGV